MNDITPIGVTNFRNTKQPFGIQDADRMGHMYVIGKTGVGKSTLLLTMAIADIRRGNGLCVIDPHGDLAETILNYIPPERIHDIVYFNPQDTERPVGFNPLHGIEPKDHHLAASGLIATFKKIWAESWGPRLEYILRMVLLTLLDYPPATLLDIQPLLTDTYFRNKVLMYSANEAVHAFWVNEFDKYPAALKAEAIAPILNKTGIFLTSLPLKNIVTQFDNTLSLQKIMDTKKILIVNLSKGTIGEDAAAILGSMLISALQLTAAQRSAIPEDDRIPFYLYVDEVHSFVSLSFADILAEARKFKLSLFLTHQYIEQLHEKIRAAIFGNVGTFISFRVGAADAEYVGKEFEPIFSSADVISLPKYHMYLKLQIEGATSMPFSATTFPLPAIGESYKDKIIEASRQLYGNPPKENLDAMQEKTTKAGRTAPPTLFT